MTALDNSMKERLSEMFSCQSIAEVDSFLREAVQNPRDRLTILKIEQEVQRFHRNSKQLQLEFQPMSSSYLRLATHRVLHHYHLQSMVVECSEGSRIVATKTSETKFPTIRLSDIPVKAAVTETAAATAAAAAAAEKSDDSSKLTAAGVEPAKVAIKQRESVNSSMNSKRGIVGSTLNPAKSVEERKEEYNKARARIFLGEEAHNFDDDDDDVVAAAAAATVACELIKPDNSSARNNSNMRVAIFRDREKDRKDPDYDRSYDRYSNRIYPHQHQVTHQQTHQQLQVPHQQQQWIMGVPHEVAAISLIYPAATPVTSYAPHCYHSFMPQANYQLHRY